MSLLGWEDRLDGLVVALDSEKLTIMLSQSTLRFPAIYKWDPTANTYKEVRPATTIQCNAEITIDKDYGFEVRIQASMSPSIQPYVMIAALNGEDARTPYRLRGRDADGGIWYANALRLPAVWQHNSPSFKATLEPIYISARRPENRDLFCEHTGIEFAIDASAKLPRTHCNLRTKREKLEEFDRGDCSYGARFLLAHIAHGGFRLLAFRSPDKRTPKQKVMDLCDSIAFATGRTVSPEIVRVCTETSASLHFFKIRRSVRNPLPPIYGSLATWQAIRSYYNFCVRENFAGRGFISLHLAELHGALSATYISSVALVAAVNVEGLLIEYVRGKSLTTKHLASLYQRKIDTLGLPLKISNFLKSQLGNSAKANAASILRQLVEAKIIDESAARVWRNRHRLAHGEKSLESMGREDAELLFASVAIIHAVSLSLIGLSKKYQIRSVTGTRTAHSKRLPQNLRKSKIERGRS